MILSIITYILIALIPGTIIATLMTKSMTTRKGYRAIIKETFHKDSLELLIAVIGACAYIASIVDVKMLSDMDKSQSDVLVVINLITLAAISVIAMQINHYRK